MDKINKESNILLWDYFVFYRDIEFTYKKSENKNGMELY